MRSKKLADRIVHEIDKIVRETFGDLVEKETSKPGGLSYILYEDRKSKLGYNYLTFKYTFEPIITIKAKYTHIIAPYEDSFRVIVVPKAKEQKLEDILRRELDDFLELILRSIKLKQFVREFIRQKLARYDNNIYVIIIDDDGQHARLRVGIPLDIELLVTYEWDSNKKTVDSMEISFIKIPINNDTLKELIFNAILSYYLLS